MSWLLKTVALKILEVILKEGMGRIEDELVKSPNNTVEKK